MLITDEPKPRQVVLEATGEITIGAEPPLNGGEAIKTEPEYTEKPPEVPVPKELKLDGAPVLKPEPELPELRSAPDDLYEEKPPERKYGM